MEQKLWRLPDPRLEECPWPADQALMAAQAGEHWLAKRELERPRWRCPLCRLRLDYCPKQCCWSMKMMMTWGLKRTGLNCLRVWGEIRVTKVMMQI